MFDIGETLKLIEMGRAAEAAPMLERLAASLPASVTVHVLLAKVYEATHAAGEALNEWQWAATLVPNSPIIQEGVERCVRAVARSGQPDSEGPQLLPAREGASVSDVEEISDSSQGVDASPDLARRAQKGPLRKTISAPASGAAPAEFEDLDRLIAELESARITPDPDFASIPPPDLEDEIDDVVSETLARIYAAQRQYDEAARVYELLAAQQPGRAKEFLEKAVQMRGLAAEE